VTTTGAPTVGPAGVEHRTPARGAAPWIAVIVPFVVSRLVSGGLIAVLAQGRSTTPAFAGFAKWDGGWYTLIARAGYWRGSIAGGETPWPFFPLYPWLIRAVHALGPSPELAGVLISHVACFVALAGLYRITTRRFPERAATLAVWTCALFPAAFVWSMVYPSALIFAACVWAFDLVEDRRDVAAGVVLIAAVMVRPNGFLCAVAIAFALRWSWRRVAIVCGPSALAFVAWCWYNHHRTGDWLRFLHAKNGWSEIDLVDFVLRDRKIAFPHVLVALAAVAAVVIVWRRLPRAWLVLTGIYLAVPLVTGMVGLGRYAGEVFPPFAAAGEILRTRSRTVVIGFLVVCVAVQAVCVAWTIRWDYLP